MTENDTTPYTKFVNILSELETSACVLAGAAVDNTFGDHEKYDIDWSNMVVDDRRGQSGKFCIYHDSDDIWRFITSENDKKLSVPTEVLIQRYRWISSCFSNCSYDTNPKLLYYWGDTARIESAYKDEVGLLKDDHYLATYWLLHFGLLVDSRYQDLKRELNECHEPFVQGAIAFIDSLDITDSFPIEPDRGNMFEPETEVADMSDAFRERRYAAMFSLCRNPKSWPQVFLSFQHSKVTPHTKAHWIVKSVTAENAWSVLRSKMQEVSQEKLGYAYLVANDPNECSAEQTKYTDIYLKQLKDHHEDWHTAINSLIAIHNIHTQTSKHLLLAEVTDLYFTQSAIDKHQVIADAYTDIVIFLSQYGITM